MKGPHVGFYTYVSEVFGFYSLKFWGVWILHPKVSEFRGVKFKHPKTLESKIQTLCFKFRGVKLKHPKTLESKIQTFLKHRGKIQHGALS